MKLISGSRRPSEAPSVEGLGPFFRVELLKKLAAEVRSAQLSAEEDRA